MTPIAHTSLRGSASREPWTCSGDMYAGVPIIMPTAVVFVPADRIFEMPKSRSFGTHLPFCCARKTFSGLMSR